MIATRLTMSMVGVVIPVYLGLTVTSQSGWQAAIWCALILFANVVGYMDGRHFK
jgi:hypothetical protein